MVEQFKQIHLNSNSPVSLDISGGEKNQYYLSHLLYFNIIMCNYFVC